MKKLFIDHNSSTRKAIEQINKLGGRSLVVVRKKNILEGVLSSRDLRKAIINKKILNSTISEIYNKKPKYIFSDELKSKFSDIYFKIKKLTFLPVIERKTHKIIDILNSKKLESIKFKNFDKINCSVVIMAGGKGTRLKPYTEVLPKPLLPIDKKPTIIHILEKFSYYSPKNFFVTLNYKSEILRSYFKEIKKTFNLEAIDEKKPLGTAGGLFYLKRKIKNYFFLTNCDTIVNHNYSNILKFHLSKKNDITIVVAKKFFRIPYGVCSTERGNFKFNEKPKLTFNVSVGLYILNRNVLNLFKKAKHRDFNDLLNVSIKKNKKIGYYEIGQKDWIDVGEMEKYKDLFKKKI